MPKPTVFLLLALLCLCLTASYAQSADSAVDGQHFPSSLLGRLKSKTYSIDRQLTKQTSVCLERMARREEKMRQRLYKTDSNAAKQLFAGSAAQYASLSQQIRTDSGRNGQLSGGTYLPYADSLQGALGFLKQHPALLVGGQVSQLQAASGELQTMQAKMQDADAVKSYIQQRKQVIGQYIAQHAGMEKVLGSSYSGMNQEAYYYGQQLRQYKEMWSNPDQLEQKALAILNKFPAFQTFMKNNSQLGGLFNLTGSYASSPSLSGLQSRDQVAELLQGQMAASGPGAASAVQSNMQNAQSQLDGYKDKLSQLGAGNGDMDMPDFKPNDQKTKSFLHRLEYGANFQTTRDNYYFPTVTDLGLSIGYRLGSSNVIGVGASYKIGWGNGIQHIALSSQGVGLRSFLEIHLKGSFSATGGFELNYTTPFTQYRELQQWSDWSKSGLIGVEKVVSMKSRVLKKTKLQLMWDFLSYEQVPRTQAILFRVAYAF